METIIVQPPGPSGPDTGGAGKPELLHMGPGDLAEFGRGLPGVGDIVERLRPLESCRGLTRSAVNYHIDYLAFAKLRLDVGDDPGADGNGRTGAKRARLASLALRFGLVREEHLALLPSRERTLPQEVGA